MALVTKTLQSPVSDFLTSSANISLHRDEHEVRGCSGFFLFIRHTTWSLYANYATSTKGLNQWKIKNVPIRGVHQTAQTVKIAPKPPVKWYNCTALQVIVHRTALHHAVQCGLRFYNKKVTQTALHRTLSIY